ncbi:hypothetical protein [Microbacterium sp. OR16]|uniref:hypothetical protein n=1 Tax=Microbacterium sp. OR16 TaxID=3095345 RepID=UPI0039B36FC6
MKKTLTSIALAGLLVVGGSTGAFAATYPVDEPDITVSDTTPTAGQPVTIRVTVPDGIDAVTFTINGAPAGSTLASAVFAAASTVNLSVDKTVTNNTASAVFTPSAPGTYTAVVTADGMEPISVQIVVAAAAGGSGAAGGSSDPLATTGSDVPAGIIWAGVGALGLGGAVIAASAVRRRANSNS